jgi:hypothetical protein
MAHPVKCSICGETFNRDKVECVATSSRRYAHKSCYDKQQGLLSEEEIYKEKIFNYVRNLFKSNFNKIYKKNTPLETDGILYQIRGSCPS